MHLRLKKEENKKKALLVSFLALVFITGAYCKKSSAESYDIYVDKNSDGDEDGSSEKPYRSISDAVKKSAGKKIFIKNGEYSESITLADGTSLYGEDNTKTIIKGSMTSTILANGNNTINNLTISGGYSSITAKGAITISQCKIKNAAKIAIDLMANSGGALIEKSDIFDGRKGIYVQKGRNISISGNNIYNNREEGLDIRSSVKGTVSGNNISSNGESGIELVVNGSSLNIKNNTIKKNDASGIANQFYEGTQKKGKINVTSNVISRNGKYGIDCNAPSGGDVPKGYWNDSLNLSKNKIERNDEKEISGSCKLIEAVSEEEEKTNEIIEDNQQEKNKAGGEINDEASKTEKKIINAVPEPSQDFVEKQNQLKAVLGELSFSTDNSIASISSQKEKLKNRSGIITFFVGYNPKDVGFLVSENEKLELHLEKLEQISQESDSDQVRLEAEKLRKKINAEIKENNQFIAEKSGKFGLFGWIAKYFYS